MGVIDYKKKAEQLERSILNSEKISQKNKKALKKFLGVYDVSDARIEIFLGHIKHLLENTTDITLEMHDPDPINYLFREFRKTKSLGYYATIVNVSLRFVRWLNNGETPKGFKDIKRVPEKKQKRNLSPQDMVTWEECEKLISASKSLQFKAIIATQLDGGFRPSEFIDLEYGDVTLKENFVIIEVKNGKTGRRNVILWRSVPHLLRWHNAHPTKKPNDPLWVQEDQTGGKIIKYKYPAMRKRIRILFQKVGLDKPYDFYSLRHSACVLSKKDNVPEELAAEKFGHSIHYYVETYGRLTAEDKIERFSRHYGIGKQKQELKKTIACKCGFVNEPDTEICEQCSNPISLGKALEIKGATEKTLEIVMKKLEEMEKTQMVMAKAIEMGVPITDKEAMEDTVIPTFFDSGKLDPEKEAKN